MSGSAMAWRRVRHINATHGTRFVHIWARNNLQAFTPEGEVYEIRRRGRTITDIIPVTVPLPSTTLAYLRDGKSYSPEWERELDRRCAEVGP